ncbi:MAG: tol-pal system protein YbgF [Gammaproteobacteria bacterium]
MKRIFNKGFLFSLIFLVTTISSDEESEESNRILYEKLSTLEQEVALLRDLLEENSYLIERYQELSQQRYLDLDKRLHDVLSKDLSQPIAKEEENTIEKNEELGLYKEALDFFDKARYSESLEKFKELIINFPEGVFTGDAYFWSGELYLAQNSFEDAKQNFLVVLNKYPQHKRNADSQFKLGVISFKLGDSEEALRYFNNVVKSYPESGSAQLAKKNIENLLKESN